MSLLSLPTANSKLKKSLGLGYWPVGLSLAPYNVSGHNVCTWAVGCTDPCVGGEKSGLAQAYDSIMEARIKKTKWFFSHRSEFMETLATEIFGQWRTARRRGLTLALRLNVFSDLEWRTIRHRDGWTIFDVLDDCPGVKCYDYTKSIRRAWREHTTEYRTRWTTVFSMSPANHEDCQEFLREGGSVAIPFTARMHELPKWHSGYRVVDGDQHDLLFLQPKNRIIGLSAKGALRTDNSEGFAIQPQDNVTFGGW